MRKDYAVRLIMWIDQLCGCGARSHLRRKQIMEPLIYSIGTKERCAEAMPCIAFL